MKKRHLRKSVQKLLECYVLVVLAFFAMLYDFDLSALPFILFLLVSVGVASFMLYTYGKDSIFNE